MTFISTPKPLSPLNKFCYKNWIFLFATLLLVSACERVTPIVSHGLPLPVQTFENIESLLLNIKDVHILTKHETHEENIDFPVSLHDSAERYLEKKLQATGTHQDGALFVILEDTHIQHTKVKSKHPVFQWLSVDNIDQYKLHLSLRLEHRYAHHNVLFGKRLSVEKTLNLSEHLSLAEREQEQFKAIEEVFILLDPQITHVIKDEMRLDFICIL